MRFLKLIFSFSFLKTSEQLAYALNGGFIFVIRSAKVAHKMLTQIGIGEISDKLALAGDGNCSGLLGSDDYHRIALLAHTYGGSVAGSELGIEILFLSQRQDTACGNYPAVAYNCGSVMERRA